MPKLEQFPQDLNNPTPPDIKFINTLNALESKKEEIEKMITKANDEEKKFLMIDLEGINKKIKNYHDSFGLYRKNQKNTELKETAGEESVAEIINFKKDMRVKKENNPELGKNFLDDLEKFKNRATKH